MLVMYSSEVDKKKRVFHRCGCMYAKRIRPENRVVKSSTQISKRKYRQCKYCAGLQGDVNIHKKAFATWSEKNNMSFIYCKRTNTLYVQTEIGFWKVFLKEDIGKYLLYHRNRFSSGMGIKEAVRGEFHRQNDMKATESLEKLVEYIVAHDRAKIIIMDDYRKLPRHSQKQKKYYKAAERKDRAKQMRRLDMLFAMIEGTGKEEKQCMFG